MSSDPKSVTVIGGGPVGCVLAVILARRGHEVVLYEMRPDMRRADIPAGRSINLVLTERGMKALDLLGLKEEVLAGTVPVIGRQIHSLEGELAYQPYGKDASECNYSVSRGALNQLLLTKAEKEGVRLVFQAKLKGADFDAGTLTFTRKDSAIETVEAKQVFGCDGAPSGVRRALCEREGFSDSMDLLEHGYKELLFPAAPGGGFAMRKDALHIWPRGSHMLMGLPNQDGSFTGTIYLPNYGADSFESLTTPEKVSEFFEAYYPDALPLIEGLPLSFLDNPTGHLGTVRSYPWHLDDRALLVGDAAHAIVPFFGQGLNCGFEDCAVLSGLLDEHGGPTADAFAAYTEARKPAGDAIADMALENFVEMRDRVSDPAFLLRKAVESRLETTFTAKYRSRYAMVMYSTIPYHHAQQAGVIQSEILDTLCEGLTSPDDVDMDQASKLIDQKLSPFVAEHAIDLAF